MHCKPWKSLNSTGGFYSANPVTGKFSAVLLRVVLN